MQELIMRVLRNGQYIPIQLQEEMLEKEKEQIINAFKRAYLIGDWDISEYDTYIAAEKYFNKTYQKKS